MKLLLIQTKHRKKKSIKHSLKPRFHALILCSVNPKTQERRKNQKHQIHRTNEPTFRASLTRTRPPFASSMQQLGKNNPTPKIIKNRNSQNSNLVSKIEQNKNHNSKILNK